MRVKMKVYRILVGKPKGKLLLGILRRKWGNNIKKDLRKIRWGGMDGIDLEGSCEHGNEPSGSIKFWEIIE
jgi:hypothetical protein